MTDMIAVVKCTPFLVNDMIVVMACAPLRMIDMMMVVELFSMVPYFVTAELKVWLRQAFDYAMYDLLTLLLWCF